MLKISKSGCWIYTNTSSLTELITVPVQTFAVFQVDSNIHSKSEQIGKLAELLQLNFVFDVFSPKFVRVKGSNSPATAMITIITHKTFFFVICPVKELELLPFAALLWLLKSEYAPIQGDGDCQRHHHLVGAFLHQALVGEHHLVEGHSSHQWTGFCSHNHHGQMLRSPF